MKKLRSVIAIVLGIALMATPAFAAADPNAEAYKLYQQAMKKLNAAHSLEMTGTMDMSIQMGATSIETQAVTTTRQIMEDGKLQMEVLADMGDLGLSTASYYKDGYFYQNVGGEKTKMSMPLNEAVTAGQELDMNLTRDLLHNATIEEVSGGTRIKFSISTEDVAAMMEGTMDDVLGSIEEGMDLKLGKISYSILIGDNGMLKSMRMTMNATITVEEMTMKTKITMNYKVKSVNKLLKIDFPSDLASYKTVS